MPAPYELFAACLPGLESLLADELQALGLAATPIPGGASFSGDLADAMRAAHWLGTASHLLVRVARFPCRALGELERKARELPWRDWLHPRTPARVHATSRGSRVYHTGAIEERLLRAIAAVLGAPPSPDTGAEAAAAQVHVRFRDDECSVSIDSSPVPLHRRGYRLATAKAPLREDLAHALVLASGWRPGLGFVDPFCGSGTLVIEAAGLALGLPPGRLRPPPFSHLALHDESAWARVPQSRPAMPGVLCGSDRDQGAIEATTANAARAGVASAVVFACAPLGSTPFLAPDQAPAHGVVATNPPFGRRVAGGRDLLPLYQTLGRRVDALGPGWRLALLAHDPRLARRVGIPLQQRFATRHGGLAVCALVGKVLAATG